MIRLKTKLALFNLLSKLAIAFLFLLILPWIIERINLRQIDNDLIRKREKIISLIENIGIEPFMSADTTFGSYNILKEEFVSLEKTVRKEDLNYIDVSDRLIEDEKITYRILNYTIIVDGQKYLLEIGRSLNSIKSAQRNIYRVILIFLIFIILITFVTDFEYSRLVLRPLGKITDKLKSISDPSSFDSTPVKTSTSDFYKLDDALRELMKNIGELFRKEKEITDNISHELLTPVSVLRVKLENLLMQKDLDPGVGDKIEESLKTLYRLQGLVDSLLFIARIESRQFLLDDEFYISEVLHEVVGEITPVAEDRGVNISEEAVRDFKLKDANRSLIFSMIYNVVNNAVKNTSSGGNVRIRGFYSNAYYNIAISDTGKGMSKEQIDKLFSRFKTTVSAREDGTGIGLAIAKTIADFHKIVVSVTSEIDKGTTFSFIFPGNS
ncbi:MAG: HAMP domain-containing sensor histidine kinase [Bacteroidota bacterium]|nr:HAMP domain-containing sensor histidine kinase [Bacteroidota bacterium]